MPLEIKQISATKHSAASPTCPKYGWMLLGPEELSLQKAEGCVWKKLMLAKWEKVKVIQSIRMMLNA